jgi:hypothetical protein
VFVALTAAAVVTTKIRVGSGVCLVIERAAELRHRAERAMERFESAVDEAHGR